MIKISILDIITSIIILIFIVAGIYGTFIWYSDVDKLTNIQILCIIISFLFHFMLGMGAIALLEYLSKKTFTINIDKIKQNLKQLIK
jgi:uncharacterized protein (DUF486 family)